MCVSKSDEVGMLVVHSNCKVAFRKKLQIDLICSAPIEVLCQEDFDDKNSSETTVAYSVRLLFCLDVDMRLP